MDAYLREALFAAAGILLVASPFLWAGIDRLVRRHRRHAVEAAEFRALMRRESMLMDAIELALDRNAVLRARAESPELLPARMELMGATKRVVDGLYPQVRDLYETPLSQR